MSKDMGVAAGAALLMAGHSPGPWHVQPHHTKRGEFLYVSNEAHALALVYVQPDAAARRANARLIAAAPDLLAAIRSALGCLDDPTGGQHVADMRRAATLLRAAIAKAEGR
jgi:hypothetical protein